eukprot:UN11357
MKPFKYQRNLIAQNTFDFERLKTFLILKIRVSHILVDLWVLYIIEPLTKHQEL